MLDKIKNQCDFLVTQFDDIPESRKEILQRIAKYIQEKNTNNQEIRLVYVCTHNSRRSHFGRVWGKVAASYYGIENVKTFSAGTEATAMHPNTVKALESIGFNIDQLDQSVNPVYAISYRDEEEALRCFSKTIDHPIVPKDHFAAIMTCAEAEENCPFVPGAELRISTTYEDPKAFDDTIQQDEKYIERSLQIARDNLYLFSLIKN